MAAADALLAEALAALPEADADAEADAEALLELPPQPASIAPAPIMAAIAALPLTNMRLEMLESDMDMLSPFLGLPTSPSGV